MSRSLAIRNNDENNASMNLFLIEKKVHPKRFAEIFERVDIDGVTIKPLDLALQLGHDKVADVLLKYGAKDVANKNDLGLFKNRNQGD